MKPLQNRIHTGLFFSLVIAFAYTSDGLSTYLAYESARETNPFVHLVSFDNYFLFTIGRCAAAILLAWIFLPSKLESTLSPSRHPGKNLLRHLFIPLPYQEKLYLIPFSLLAIFMVVKISAASSNLHLYYLEEPLLGSWSQIVHHPQGVKFAINWMTTLLMGYLFSQGLLYWLWKVEKENQSSESETTSRI